MSDRQMKSGTRDIGGGLSETVSPVAISVRCRWCEWSHTETRHQNALARAAKMRAAINKHNCPIYVTSFCNHAHRLSDGVPIAHECYVLPPVALRLERTDDFEGAANAIQAAKPLRIHRGVK